MEIIDIIARDEKFIKFIDENWKDGECLWDYKNDYDYPIRFNIVHKGNKRLKWWQSMSGSLARAKINKKNIKIMIRKFRTNRCDFNSLKNLFKEYEQKEKVKIILMLMEDY